MRAVADGAAFAQGFVFKNERARLFTMTLRTSMILPRHGQPACWFKNIAAVRIMALHTTHVPLNHRMMRGQLEFCPGLQMTTKTRVGIFAGIDDKFALAAANFDMPAARSVT